jgi:hypothetical protein
MYTTHKITLLYHKQQTPIKHIPEQYTIAPGHFYNRTVNLTYDKNIKTG